MSEDLPDFTKHGYQLRAELGQNRLGGRTTYLATNSLSYPVVIKQFQFATSGSTWGEYEAYQQEITMLRRLQHPGIPRYLDAFQTPDGFCMVQQYIPGESLAAPRNWTPQEIKHIAIATLEILTYLQSQHPPIIHRDIKPENILVDEQLNIHLVDFGFARMGGGEIAASSVVKGTMGFMPPEQLFNRQLTTASDLYGLGATLICLLTGTKSGDIGNLIDADYQIHFQHLVPPLKRGWINWLAKITAPKVAERYPSAAAALKALQPIDVDRLPKLIISHNSLQFTATKWQGKVSQIVTLSNPIPETLLAGQFSVAPHPSDPPHTPYDHAWISFQPAKFEGNEVNCEMTVDTSKLLADTSYTREVWVQSNADAEPEVITVTVQTAPLPKPISIGGWVGLVLVLVISGLVGWGLAGGYELFLFAWIAVWVGLEWVSGAVYRNIGVNVLAILASIFMGITLPAILFKILVQPLVGIILKPDYFSSIQSQILESIIIQIIMLLTVAVCLIITNYRSPGNWLNKILFNLAILPLFFNFLFQIVIYSVAENLTGEYSYSYGDEEKLLWIWLLIFCLFRLNVVRYISLYALKITFSLIKVLNLKFKSNLNAFFHANCYYLLMYLTAVMGLVIGLNAMLLTEFFDGINIGNLRLFGSVLSVNQTKFYDFIRTVFLGFIPVIGTGVMLAIPLNFQVKLRADVAKYDRQKLLLIKP